MDILNSIEEIQKMIFDFDIKTAMNKIGKLIEDLIIISSKLSVTRLNEFMEILNLLNSSLINKDYVLYNDILEYKLKLFLQLEEII